MVRSAKYTLPARSPDSDGAVEEMATSYSNSPAPADMLTDPKLIQMGTEGFIAFIAILDVPATPVLEIVEGLRRPAPWEVDRGPGFRNPPHKTPGILKQT